MRVIITGGTGLIGSALAQNLVSDGYEVIILTRSPKRATGLPAGVRAEGWDARTADGWGKWVEGATAIVNLAGASVAGEAFLPARWTDERKRLLRDSRIRAGEAVVEAVERAEQKPGVVIQASGIGYYGFHGNEVLDEGAPPGHDFLARLAAFEWEPSTAAVEALGVRRAVVRTGVVLATEGGALPRQLLPFRLFVGGPMGSGKQWVSWIHLVDEVGAIRFLIEHPEAEGAFNLAAPGTVTNAQFAQAIGRVLKRPSLVPLPGFVMKMAFGEVAEILLEGQRAEPRRLQELGYRFRFSDAEAALRDLVG